MSIGYADTSAIVSVAFREPGSLAVEQRLRGFSTITSSHLMEAELRAAYARNNLRFDPRYITGIIWVEPNRPLSAELASVLQVGYLRGADLWHVAAALYSADDPRDITFITLDARQQAVAAALGFRT